MDAGSFCGLFVVLPALLAVVPAVWLRGFEGFVLWVCIASPVVAFANVVIAVSRHLRGE